MPVGRVVGTDLLVLSEDSSQRGRKFSLQALVLDMFDFCYPLPSTCIVPIHLAPSMSRLVCEQVVNIDRACARPTFGLHPVMVQTPHLPLC